MLKIIMFLEKPVHFQDNRLRGTTWVKDHVRDWAMISV
jgi:hypothetical protein